MVRHLMLGLFAAALLVVVAGCLTSPTPHPLGSIVVPGSCASGLFLGGNGLGNPLTCQQSITRNGHNPPGLPLFSPVTTTETINANGDRLNGSGYFFGCNRGGTHCENTHGVGFWVMEAGHQATGVRFYWQGDPTWEQTTNVRCRLWDFRTPGTSVATGTIAVAQQHEYNCVFGSPYTMTAGRPYAASIVDIGACTPGGCVLGATLMNAIGVDAACGNMYANFGGPLFGSPWLLFSEVETGNTGEHYSWPDLVSSSTGDSFPQGTDNNCEPIEPIVQ
jgi:hypothetical protein